MSSQKKQWAAIIIMIALFAMIAFVTNLCSPMAVIVKNQFGASNFMAQVGNYGNFIAYLIMGIPSGILIKKIGYKKTALLALIVGIVGIFVQWMSGWDSIQSFVVYLLGAFIGGFCMCMLNTVVNPMLNLLGGGGKEGNQLIQIGGVFNSAAAVAVYIIMGALIGDAAKARISDATPALFIAMGIFVVAFFVILFTKIEEPVSQKEAHEEMNNPVESMEDKHSAFSFRHFNLGILAIFLYMGIEVGTPTYMIQYLSSDTKITKDAKLQAINAYEAQEISAEEAAQTFFGVTNMQEILASNDADKIADMKKQIADQAASISNGEITSASIEKSVTGHGLTATMAALIAAVYWLMMLVGRFLGGVLGGKISARQMILAAGALAMILIAFGMFASTEWQVSVPGIDWANLKVMWAQVPVGILSFILVGLCTSVMWGGIFNLATEGLGKYTSIASGAFMTMVFGCAIMVGLQGWLADASGSFLTSYWVVFACAAYVFFYALVGYKNVNTDIKVD